MTGRQLNQRVSARLRDAAAVEIEHGRELVSNMLIDEANALDQGRVFSMVNFESKNGVPSDLNGLRNLGRERKGHRKAVELADEIIATCWTLEGHGVREIS